MDSKKALIAVVLIALVAGIYFSRKGGSGVMGTSSGGMAMQQGAVVLPSGGGEVPSGSMLHGVRSDVLAVMHVSPRNVDPAVNYLERFWGRIAATKLGQANGLKNSLIETARAQAKNTQDPAEVEKAEKAFEILSNGWNELQEAVFIVSSQSIEGPQGAKIPYMLVQGKFSNSATTDKLNDYLNKEILKGQESLTDNDGKISKRAGAEGVYDYEMSGGPEHNIPGAVFLNGDTVAFTIGATDIDSFKATDEEQMLVSGNDWRAIGVSLLPATGLFMYLDYPKLQTMIDGLVDVAVNVGQEDAASADDLRKQLNSQFADLGVLGASVDFDGGFNSLSCVKTEEGSKMGNFYKRLMEARSNSTQPGIFHKLVSENALFAFRFQLDTVPFYFDFFREYYGDALDQAQAGQDAQRFRAMLDNAEAAFNRLGFKELGIVASLAPGNPMPEVGLFLGQGSLQGEEALTAVAESLNEFLPQPVASVDSSTGSPRLQINTGQPVPVGGAMVGQNSVYITSNPYAFDKVSKQLESGASYLASNSKGLENSQEALEGGDYFIYANTELLLQMVRPWIGMAAAQAPGSAPEDIQELAELFGGRFISTQLTSGAAENVVCSRAQMLTLQ